MKKKTIVPAMVAMVLACCLGPNVMAEGEWHFGIGTGLSTLALDGDLGIASSGGPLFFDVDLDNSDTSDLLSSGFGLGGFAAKDKWAILFQGGSLKLEDNSSGLNAEWKKSQLELLAAYTFLKTDRNALAGIFGVRYTDHDWDVTTSSLNIDIDESWTDGVLGITHRFTFADKWTWRSRADYSMGGSEGSYLVSTGIAWQAFEHWSFSADLKVQGIDYGEDSDSGDSDFYRYNVDETGLGLGFIYTW